MISPSSGALDMQEIMQYLKDNGQRFDSEIAAATGISLAKVRRSITDLSARGEISKCSVTRFGSDGEKGRSRALPRGGIHSAQEPGSQAGRVELGCSRKYPSRVWRPLFADAMPLTGASWRPCLPVRACRLRSYWQKGRRHPRRPRPSRSDLHWAVARRAASPTSA
jgi:hypothetical protein